MYPGGDKETEAYDQSRMLEDHNGKPSYLGDSATMSCLQLIRKVVERATGPFRTALTLPDKKAAEALVESFFVNTHGLIDIFDRRSFLQKLGAWYSSPLSVRSSDLCLIYLVLSIGLVMATPAESSPEHHIVTQLRSHEVDHVEVFFRSAKALGDSVCRFEDGEFWTVQALCLMSVYTLAVSKQNAAYAHLGQAVRSAYALGLHKIRESAFIFKNEHLQQRRNLWRSLYVLDRFLAMSLGRPTAISEDDCPDDSLEAPTRPSGKTKMRRDQIIGSNGLNANVQASRIISKILKKVYLKPEISTDLTQDIADDYKHWSNDLHNAFDSNNLFKSDIAPAQAMAVLHTQLLGCHSIILLTRPIFMYLLVRAQKSRLENQAPVLDPTSRMEMFSETCITASTKTIRLAQAVFDLKRLPRSNPFIL
ncbi:hypothetical protein QQX98_003679 [Neonectria punicea]|uniref:Xylanolytic transcriptional activator regulatory domain-containing protein n=1 Tax=Neonectria punicea TaxID=979145 RepID=A0ABR1HD98_9HYPO